MEKNIYEMPEDPEYKTDIKALNNKDRASAEQTFNPLFQNVLENIHAVKKAQEQHEDGDDHDNRYYTQDDVDNKFSAMETNIDWKESVSTFADITKSYPNPDDGWTVNVKDTDYTYRWTGKEWVAISANAIPIATKAVDGKMSSEQAAKLDRIEDNANNYSHPSFSAGTVGETADKTLTHGGKFIVPQVGRDDKGHVETIAGRTMTIPALDMGAASAGTLAIERGGTGAAAAAAARTNLGVPPTNHTSTETATYGAASEKVYGHAMASGTTPKAAGAANVGTEMAKFARGDHVHPVQSTITGNAGTATKLETARNLNVSEGITGTAVSFDGSANATIKVTKVNVGSNFASGTLPIANGGTGATEATAARTNLGVPPISHTSTEATTYGAASAAVYGHAMASGTKPKEAGTASAGTETTKFARGDHVHPAQSSITGNAATATKLAAAKNLNLSGGVTGTVTGFDGSAAVTIPVTKVNVGSSYASGTLPIANGGTGATTAASARTNIGVPEVQAGYLSVTPKAVQTTYSLDVNYPKTFSSTPVVMVNPHTSVPHVVFVSASNVTSTGFTLYYRREASTTEFGISWLATPRT